MSQKPSTSRKSCCSPAPQQPAIAVESSEDSEEIFEVEAILDKRILAGKVSVFVSILVSYSIDKWTKILYVHETNVMHYTLYYTGKHCDAFVVHLHWVVANLFEYFSPYFSYHIQPQYFIKYKGYDDTENTWEPPSNLNCPRLIREFERNLLRKKNDVRQYFEFERILAKRTVDGNKVSIRNLSGIVCEFGVHASLRHEYMHTCSCVRSYPSAPHAAP